MFLRKAGLKQLHSQPSLTTESFGKLKINVEEWRQPKEMNVQEISEKYVEGVSALSTESKL